MKEIIRLLLIVLILSIIASLQSCEKEIDIRYKRIPPITVIEGSLTGDGASVRITMTTPMDEPMDTVTLTDAVVTLMDLNEGTSMNLYPDIAGCYVSDKGGVTGHTYILKVGRGEQMFSSECEMTAAVEIRAVEFNWIKMPYDHVAVFQVTFSDDPAESGEYYWVRLYRNGSAYMWALYSDLNSRDGEINAVFMTSRKDLEEEDEATALRDGDVMTVTVSQISREMYDYLEAVSSDSNGPSLFSGDFCLGYFLAAHVSEASTVFKPDSIPFY